MNQLWLLLAGGCLLLSTAGPAACAEQEAAPAPPAGPSMGVSAKGPHHIYLVGNLLVTEPWIEVDPQAPGEGSAYFVIQNRGGFPDKLVAASSDLADRIEVDDNGAAPGLGDGTLVIPPRQTVVLKPTGVHFLFHGFHRDIRGEATVPGLLMFAHAGPLHLDFATDPGQATIEDETQPAAAEPSSLVK